MRTFARLIGALTLFAGTAFAQPYPAKPVRVIVPYPTGGIVDLLARAVTEKIASGWGQPILVEGRPGADGNLGTEAVAKGTPDGYTWLMTGPAILSNPTIYDNLSWSPLRDFQGVGVTVWNLNIAVVPASLPVSTLQEFVAYAKARPGQLNFGNPGTGSSNHTPNDVVARINGEINKALSSPEVQERIEKIGGLPGPAKTPDEIQTMMKSDYERWGRVVRAAGIKPSQ